ncbi:unnamed protein product [Amoebophrya sp. A120]|nr:unnamed protein product [Amoebophrya sp. A120]|eukprot:GSA120T00008059001.1
MPPAPFSRADAHRIYHAFGGHDLKNVAHCEIPNPVCCTIRYACAVNPCGKRFSVERPTDPGGLVAQDKGGVPLFSSDTVEVSTCCPFWKERGVPKRDIFDDDRDVFSFTLFTHPVCCCFRIATVGKQNQPVGGCKCCVRKRTKMLTIIDVDNRGEIDRTLQRPNYNYGQQIARTEVELALGVPRQQGMTR